MQPYGATMCHKIWLILIAAVLAVSSASALTLDEIKCNSPDSTAEERNAACARHERDSANKRSADKLKSRFDELEARILSLEMLVFGLLGRPKEK